MKVKILGTEYKIVMNAEEKDYPILKDADGYADFTIKKIVVKKLIQDGESYENLELWQRKTLRHEIVHAFLYESGLWQNSFNDWARNEEMTDWIALQFEKILGVFIELQCIDSIGIDINTSINDSINFPKVKVAKASIKDNTETMLNVSKTLREIPIESNMKSLAKGGVIRGDG